MREPTDVRRTVAEERIPIVEEQIVVAKRERETERVRVHTTVETHEELVTDELRSESLELERRPVELPVATAPAPRQEGDATIISIVEERAVVTKQLFVVEEVVVRRRVSTERFSAPVQLRRTRATVEQANIDPILPQQEDH